MENDTLTLAQRKQSVLLQLEATYAAKGGINPKTGGVTYLPTWQLADTQSSDSKRVNAITLTPSHTKMWALLIFAGIGCFICYQILRSQGLAVVYASLLSSIFLLMGIGALRGLMDKKNHLIIDETGIFYGKWQDGIPWHRILGMWVRTGYRANNYEELFVTNCTLFVHYYDERFDDCFSREVDLNDFDKNAKSIAFLLEHIKQAAGFPTASNH